MEHYLDHAATTKPCPEAIAAVQSCLTHQWGNPSSLHSVGLTAEHILRSTRQHIADVLHCKSEEILFTSGATESNNLALHSAAALYSRRRKKIIVSAVEHASVRQMLQALEGTYGLEIEYIAPRQDGYHAEDFLSALDEHTLMVSAMAVNNENGCILPVQEIFSGVKRYDKAILTHCDAVQAFMKLPLSLRSLQADYLTVSAHKIHGIKGAGALFVRSGRRIAPLLYGGHQESGLRPGTENVPAIAAFGAAVTAYAPLIQENYTAVSARCDQLTEGIRQLTGALPRRCVSASPYICAFSLPGYRSEILLHYLEKKGIYVSSGSACSKGKSSGVLETFGFSREEVDSVLRVSINAETTQEDIEALLTALAQAKKELLNVWGRKQN